MFIITIVYIITIAFTTWSTSKANLPDIEGTREETQNVESEGKTTPSDDSRNAKKRSFWVVLFCAAYLLFYALVGSRVKESNK